jgi:hypothetical protein
MHSLVGVPMRDCVYGNLYVTEKRGKAEFMPPMSSWRWSWGQP